MLAGALGDAGVSPSAAFAHYPARLRPFLRRKQESAARFASAFVPRTTRGIRYRNVVTHLLRIPLLADLVIGRDLRDHLSLD